MQRADLTMHTTNMHTTTYRFWQAQIKKATECYDGGCMKKFWERRVENATRCSHEFSECILRDYGREYWEAVTRPEWFDFLDLLCT